MVEREFVHMSAKGICVQGACVRRKNNLFIDMMSARDLCAFVLIFMYMHGICVLNMDMCESMTYTTATHSKTV